MANIQITDLPLNTTIGEKRVFKDLRLDLQFGQPDGVRYFSGTKNNDLVADFDTQAIINSLQNLFTTNRGEKILNPEYGSDVGKYIFLPVNDINGESLGDTILESIRSFEPRILVDTVTVYKDEDNNEYTVDLNIIIPALRNASVTVTGKLNNSGFIFV